VVDKQMQQKATKSALIEAKQFEKLKKVEQQQDRLGKARLSLVSKRTFKWLEMTVADESRMYSDRVKYRQQ
jgi:hypothetical protein